MIHDKGRSSSAHTDIGMKPPPIGLATLRFLLTVAIGLVWTGASLPGTTVVPPKFSELVNGSDFVVRARVKSVRAEARVKNGAELIYTKVELQVLEVIAGTPPQPLVLTMLGGHVGDRTMKVEGAPEFIVGSEDILFVKGNGRTFSPIYAMMHGQYPLLRDEKKGGRQYVNRSNLVPLLSTDEVAQPMQQGDLAERLRRMRDPSKALTPVEFAQAVRNTRKFRNELPASQP